MTEYFTEAIVLDKLPQKEQDARVVLYTQELGKVTAKVKSARKITSKLNGHLEPLNIVKIRIIEKGGLQAVDALTVRKLPVSQLPVLALVNELTGEWEPDPILWTAVTNERMDQAQLLRILGFDSTFAACGLCERKENLQFSTIALNYFCGDCYTRE